MMVVQPTTSTTDESFDFISVAYHALQGSATANTYATDARKQGDADAEAFFKKVHEQYEAIADQAKEMMKDKL